MTTIKSITIGTVDPILNPKLSKSIPPIADPANNPKEKVDVKTPDTRPCVSMLSGKPLSLAARRIPLKDTTNTPPIPVPNIASAMMMRVRLGASGRNGAGPIRKYEANIMMLPICNATTVS